MPLDSSLFWDFDTGCLKAALYIPGYKMDTPKNIKKTALFVWNDMKAPSDERIKEDIERVKLYWQKGLAADGSFVEDDMVRRTGHRAALAAQERKNRRYKSVMDAIVPHMQFGDNGIPIYTED